MKRHKRFWLINGHNDDNLDMQIRIEQNKGFVRFGRFSGAHEIYAILKEELDEFWDSVKGNDPDPKELLQICAVARRAIIEISDWARQELETK